MKDLGIKVLTGLAGVAIMFAAADLQDKARKVIYKER